MHSTLPADPLPTVDLRKVSADAFLSFMREYLDPVVKADQFAQYVDNTGIAANNDTDLTRNIRVVFKCIRQAGLKLTIEKCHFGVRQVEFLGRTISSQGVLPQSYKIQKLFEQIEFPQIQKSFRKSGLRNSLQKLFSQSG